MAGYNVPASRNGLPLKVATGRVPVYDNGVTSPTDKTNLVVLGPIARPVFGTAPDAPAVLPVNATVSKENAAVRVGTVSGVGNIKRVAIASRQDLRAGVPIGGVSPSNVGGGGAGSGGGGGASGGSGSGGASDGLGRISPDLQVQL